MDDVKWGLVTTFLGPSSDILKFAAYHLDKGAHRLFIFLDDPDSDAYAPLKAHSKIRVFACDTAHWKKLGGKRPVKHQVRQSRNATYAYRRKQDIAWLGHIDVDEFLVTDAPVGRHLGKLADDAICARMRPMEQLAGDGTAFKAFLPSGPARKALVAQLYPTYGSYLRAGFLSHVAGKIFVRTGLQDMHLRIHNAFQGDDMNPGEVELPGIDLAHCHAKTWDDWMASYQFRLEQGSYRSEIPSVHSTEKGGLTIHEMFSAIEAHDGAAGLRAFYDEVAGDSPELRARLEDHGALRLIDLDLDATVARHFPQIT